MRRGSRYKTGFGFIKFVTPKKTEKPLSLKTCITISKASQVILSFIIIVLSSHASETDIKLTLMGKVNLYYVLHLSTHHKKSENKNGHSDNHLTSLHTVVFYTPVFVSDQEPWWTSTTIISERWQPLQTTHCQWAFYYCCGFDRRIITEKNIHCLYNDVHIPTPYVEKYAQKLHRNFKKCCSIYSWITLLSDD